jgi:3-hydroxyacyl-CoA dehydrogenase / 3-hydroxy-2-methylbutyryl-CoA dehydrogenase
MTLPMARDLARHSVRVVTLAPSLFYTPMTGVAPPKVLKSLEREMMYPKRAGLPEEFARTVLWVLDTPFVNGEVIRLSGASRMPARL